MEIIMKKIVVLLGLIAMVLPQRLCSQKKQYRKAAKYMSKANYNDAAVMYSGMVQNGDSSITVLSNLADAHFKMAAYDQAANWYALLWKRNKDSLPSEYMYRYALCLKTTGNYVKSDSIMRFFASRNENDSRAQKFMSKKDYTYWINAKKTDFLIHPFSMNSGATDYAPSLYKEKLVFSSDRDSSVVSSYIDKRSNGKRAQLFIENNAGTQLMAFSEDTKSKFNDASVAFTKNLDTLYITRNNHTKRRFKRDKLGYSRLQTYRMTKVNQTWGNIEKLPFNDVGYSVAHPSISPDGKKLFFTSDRPGGFGESDIYYVDIHEDGSFSEPVNLGPEINTEGRETFAHLANNGVLFFASDGHPGLGGLDIYGVRFETGMAKCVVNLGSTINSPWDDMGMVMHADNRSGYIASARNDNQMDIYAFETNNNNAFSFKCVSDVTVSVTHAQNKEKQSDVLVSLFDADNVLIGEGHTNDNGLLSLAVPLKKGTHRMAIQKTDYKNNDSINVVVNEDNAALELKLEIHPKQQHHEVVKLDVLAKLDLPSVWFHFDSTQLTAQGKESLDKVVAYLNVHNYTHLTISGHTDAYGSAAYNKQLSLKRALRVKTYLESRGVASGKLSAHGYGFEQLLNNCKQAKNCNKLQNQQNRRVNIEIEQ
jgi:outer membrane protein OmpA-like peptidoglycan-associated protein